jgi:hypothetical protein
VQPGQFFKDWPPDIIKVLAAPGLKKIDLSALPGTLRRNIGYLISDIGYIILTSRFYI